MNKLGIAIVGSSLLAPSLALAAPGDLLVTEAEGGSVLVFTEGGDLSEATRFATGLSNPTGICIGPGGDIYVSETNTGQITVLGDGGDLTDAEPYATGLVGMGSLWCDDERIIISCPACPSPGVVEIQTEGVIAQNATFFALNLPLTGDLFFDATGDLLVVAMDVYNIEVGGDLTGATPFTTGQTMLAGMDIGGTLLGAEFLGPRIFDVTAGGDLSDAAPWATLPALAEGEGVQAMLHSAVGDYVLNGEDIYLVPPGGGDLTGADPFATGLNTGVQGLQGMAYHVCGNNDDCADDDLCNGDELCVNNACEAPRGPPDCDDENVCTADSCDAIEGCVNAPVEGCCLIDLDCEVDELCDVRATRVCRRVCLRVTTGAIAAARGRRRTVATIPMAATVTRMRLLRARTLVLARTVQRAAAATPLAVTRVRTTTLPAARVVLARPVLRWCFGSVYYWHDDVEQGWAVSPSHTRADAASSQIKDVCSLARELLHRCPRWLGVYGWH
ncbi:MAG: hypothetical protein JKY37_03065 [Nannocystaceae bacterium]|nr:hypothetical protein [Nannocystaceae bacterium]